MYKIVNNPYNTTVKQYIKRLSDGAAISKDESNQDYKEYLKWVAEGNEPEPADEVNQ